MTNKTIVTLKGVVKKTEIETFNIDNKDVQALYIYLEQDDSMSLTKVQVKPLRTPINKGDKFNADVEVSAKMEERRPIPKFVYNAPVSTNKDNAK